jgi:hypothetical protein
MDTNPAVSHSLARKKSTGSLRRKRSDTELHTDSPNTPSDQKSRDAKSAPYRDARYSVILATKGSIIDKDDFGIVKKSKQLVQELLNTEQTVAQESLFRDDSNNPVSWRHTTGPIMCQEIFDKGGHFAGWERPEAVAKGLCEMFRKGGGAYGAVKGRDGC